MPAYEAVEPQPAAALAARAADLQVGQALGELAEGEDTIDQRYSSGLAGGG
jgi:hypothetical protein